MHALLTEYLIDDVGYELYPYLTINTPNTPLVFARSTSLMTIKKKRKKYARFLSCFSNIMITLLHFAAFIALQFNDAIKQLFVLRKTILLIVYLFLCQDFINYCLEKIVFISCNETKRRNGFEWREFCWGFCWGENFVKNSESQNLFIFCSEKYLNKVELKLSQTLNETTICLNRGKCMQRVPIPLKSKSFKHKDLLKKKLFFI